MGSARPRSTAGGPPHTTDLSPILVPLKTAFRALSISDKVGYRLARERVIPTVTIPYAGRRVLVDELKKMLAVMVQVDRLCRTCARKDDKGRCGAWASPPSDVANCKAWTFDEMWNVKEWADMSKYEEKKGGEKGGQASGRISKPKAKTPHS